MSKKNLVQFPSEGIWRSIKDAKSHNINHLKVTAGKNTTIVDTPLALNLRIIPGVFTAPLQAIGLVTSIFARVLNTRITLYLNDDED